MVVAFEASVLLRVGLGRSGRGGTDASVEDDDESSGGVTLLASGLGRAGAWVYARMGGVMLGGVFASVFSFSEPDAGAALGSVKVTRGSRDTNLTLRSLVLLAVDDGR